MNERERFLRMIEAEPQDDAVRLVFADWLEENGEEDRARFVRLQCEHHRARAEAGDPARQRKLEQEIEALLNRHRAAWTAGLPAWAEEVAFERGSSISQMTGKQFLDTAAAVRAVAPLDALFLRLLKGREVAVCASEHLGGVSRLWVSGAQLTDAGIIALTSSPHLGRLRQLWAERKSFLDDDKDANKLTDVSAFALAEADNLPSLTNLDLAGYKKTSLAAIRALVESARRAGLTALDLSKGLGGPEVAELFRAPACRLTGLRELRLNNSKLGDAGAAALAGAPALRNLRVLGVTQNKIGDRGATALASSPHLAGLVDLDLWKNALTDAGVRALLASEHLRGLRGLQLGECPRITDTAARAILDDGRAWAKVGLDGTQVSSRLKAEIAVRCESPAGGT